MNSGLSHPSPDGRFRLDISMIPMRMSHEVCAPDLIDTATNQVIFQCGSLWDASGVRWSEDSRILEMEMRHYDNGLTAYELQLDIIDRTAALSRNGERICEGSFEKVSKKMERGVRF